MSCIARYRAGHGTLLAAVVLGAAVAFPAAVCSAPAGHEPEPTRRAAHDAPRAADAEGDRAASRTYYVDPLIGTAVCRDYAAAQRRCGPGTETAYRELNPAAAAAQPGDSVLIRQGNYADSFVPQKSGTAAAPIRFRRYPGEAVRIRLGERPALPAIVLNDRHHLVLDGLTVDGAGSWAQVWKSTHILIENSTFRNARDRGSRGGFRMVDSDHNRILNNRFEDGNDNLMLENSNRNLVQGNSFRSARHTLLVIACGNYNVIRENEFHNELQKAAETFDCEGKIQSLHDGTRQVRRMEATRRNVWERNRFLHTRASEKWYKYNAIQFAGQHGIVRHNVMVDNRGGGIGIQMYADEALHNYGNRIYHNTLYNNRCFGILGGRRTVMRPARNIVINNLLSENLDCNGRSRADIVNYDGMANQFFSNYTGKPGFMDAGNHDYRLRPDSPAIDAGAFLTRAVGAGANSTLLKVEDSGYFFDGYGIRGLMGDEIRLEDDTASAVIVSVDESTHTLRLDRLLTWKHRQGVALRYSGRKPDAGAFEVQ